jgi:hypothetical protein
MRRPRETNPALAAQRDAKRGMKSQVPGNRVTRYFQPSSAGVLPNLIVGDLEVEWISPSGAQLQTHQRKTLNEAFWLPILRKPCGPQLKGHSCRVSRTALSPRIHQQISEPPGPATIRQTQANEPDFITAASRERGEYFVQRRGLNTEAAHPRRIILQSHADMRGVKASPYEHLDPTFRHHCFTVPRR